MTFANIIQAVATVASSVVGDDPIVALDDEPPSSAAIAAGLSCLAISCVGAIAAASLLTFSQAKVGRALDDRTPDDTTDPTCARLAEHREGYHVLGRGISITSLVAGALFFWEADPSGSYRPLLMTGYGLLAIAGCAVVPGELASTRAEGIVIATHRLLDPVRRVLHYPILAPAMGSARLMLKLLRLGTPPSEPEGMADEIRAAVEDSTGGEAGLDADEAEWIENIVALKDTQASEVMTPRTDVVAFATDMPLADAVRAATQAGHSRYPVYEERVDNVVGVFYAKDVLPLLNADASPGAAATTVGDHMRAPLFVPESISVVELLRQFRASRVQMVIVLDEYGGTAGIASIEDVLEEIVGEITDEYDPAEADPIEVIEQGRIVETSGRVRIDEINEALPIALPETEDYDTVAGFVFTSLDRIPRVAETVEIEGVRFEVLEGDNRRIHRLRVTAPDGASVPAAE